MQDSLLEKQIDKTKDNIRRKTALTRKAQEHLEILKKYYKVDTVNRVVTVTFHHKKASEIIDVTQGSKAHPLIHRDFLVKISNIATYIPKEFKINIDLTIDDYESYSHGNITKSIIDAFELFQYEADKDKGLSNLKVAFLIGFGIIVLAWLYFVHCKWFMGEQYSTDPNFLVIFEIIYIVGEVVIWEALYIIFLPSHDYKDIHYYITTRIYRIYIRDKSGKLLDEINGKKMYHQIRVASTIEIRARKALLIFGAGLMCIAMCKLTDLVEICLNLRGTALAVSLTISILVFVCTIMAGVGAISYYRDKGPFKRFVNVFAIASISALIIDIIVVSIFFNDIGNMSIKILVLSAILLAVSIAYLVCILILRHKQNQSFNRTKSSKQQIKSI